MSQLARLISILTLLKSKRLLTSTELSERFDVSVRTIYRDIRKLEETGVPIITIEGKGYSLLDSYSVAPVQFSEKEANALITAQHLVKQTQDQSFITDFTEAMIKIKSVFKTSVLEKSEQLSKKIHVFENYYEDLSSNALAEIQLAIIHLKLMEINYQKANDPEISFRKIEPYTLISTNRKWILIAWCYLREEYRSFRVDRIRQFKVMHEQFEDRNFSLQQYFKDNPLPPEIKKYKKL